MVMCMKQSSLMHGALLLCGGNIFLRLCSMFFQVYLSRTIGAEGMGLLQLIFTVNGLAMILGCSGVRTASMILSAEEHGRNSLSGVRCAVRACLIYGLLVSMVVGAVFFFLANPIASHWIGNDAASGGILIAALFLPFSCLCAVMGGYFTACGKLKQYIGVEIGERLLSFAITLLLLQAWAKDNLSRACVAIIGGSSIGSALDFIVLFILYRHNCQGSKKASPISMRRRLLRLCIPLALNDYLRYGLATIEQFLIPYGLQQYGYSYTSSMQAYGMLHGMVFPTLMFPAVLLYSLSDLLIPALSRARAQNNSARICSVTEKCLHIGFLFAIGIGGFFLICAKPLGILLFHDERAGIELQIYAPLTLILYVDAIVDGVLKGLSEQVSNVRYNTLTSCFDVFGLLLLLPRYGMKGFFLSFLLTHVLNLFLSIRRLCFVTKWYPSLWTSLWLLLASAMALCFTVWCIPSSLPKISLLLLRTLVWGLLFCGIVWRKKKSCSL